MKKSVVIAVLGLAAASTTTAFGQGAINIGNYRGSYNPVLWDPSVPDVGGARVNASHGVQLTLWYGEGTGVGALTSSLALTWNTVAQGNGFVGYYDAITVTLPNWSPGDIYSFQVRASGDTQWGPVIGSSEVWQETSNIGNIGGEPPGPPGVSANSIGLSVAIVPEPSSFALLGLGAAGLALLRRRQ